jgi:centrosomal protein CEP164
LAPEDARQQRSGAAERAPAPKAAARPGQRRATMPEVSPSPTGPSPPGDSIILEEEIDPNYVPSQDEIDEYAKWLGMDLVADKDLQWIAREGLKAPLPEHWKPCKTTDTDEIYYFNFSSGESTWDHPCDEYYRTLYEVPPRRPKRLDLLSWRGRASRRWRAVRRFHPRRSSARRRPTTSKIRRPRSRRKKMT